MVEKREKRAVYPAGMRANESNNESKKKLFSYLKPLITSEYGKSMRA